MENFLHAKEVWIVGSVCIVVSILWRKFWSLFTHKRKQDKSAGGTSVQLKEKKKSNVCLEVLHSQKKEPPDVTDQDDVEKVQMLNQQNTSLSHDNNEVKDIVTGLVDYIQDEKEAQTEKKSGKERLQAEGVGEEIKKEKHIFIESGLDEKLETNKEEENQRIENGDCLSVPEVSALLLSTCEFNQDHDVSQESNNDHIELFVKTKRRVENLEKDLKKSKVEEKSEEVAQSEEEKQPGVGASEVEQEKPAEEREKEPMPGEYIIDNSPPPPAPFEHRVVTTKTKHIATYYTINRKEVLGG